MKKRGRKPKPARPARVFFGPDGAVYRCFDCGRRLALSPVGFRPSEHRVVRCPSCGRKNHLDLGPDTRVWGRAA